MQVEKVTVVYAIVNDPPTWREFKVWPNGQVEIWKTDECNVGGFWDYYYDYEDDYEEVKQRGLAVLKDEINK